MKVEGGATGRITRAWLAAAKRLAARRPGPDVWNTRHALIERLAPGKSFLDLGGMYGIAGDVAFRAEAAGATRVVLFDGMDPSEEFMDRHAAEGSKITYVQGDLHDPDDMDRLGKFDVVWCGGVIYHSPNPYQCIYHLRRLATEYLMLGTHVIPEIPGIEGGCIFYPGRSPAAEGAFAKSHDEPPETYPGMTARFVETENLGYVNMWWGISPSALRGMLRYGGFEVEEWIAYHVYLVDVLARVGSEPSFIPPLGFSRARGAERLRDWDGAAPGWAPADP